MIKRSIRFLLPLAVGLGACLTTAFLLRPAAAMPPAEADTLRRDEIAALREIAQEIGKLRQSGHDSALQEIAREVSHLRDAVRDCQRK